jgi:hypothetical protein
MILVCGEALIDLFVGPAEGAEMPARAVAGGSPFNVAIGLARLGVDASFLGGISRDRFGALLARTLVREGVDDRFLVRTDRLSTISMVATDDNGQPSYAVHGERAADRSFALTNLPAELPPDVQGADLRLLYDGGRAGGLRPHSFANWRSKNRFPCLDRWIRFKQAITFPHRATMRSTRKIIKACRYKACLCVSDGSKLLANSLAH